MKHELPEWKLITLRESLELLYGKSLRKDKRKNGPIPIFGSNGIIGYTDEYLSKSPGIIIGRKGSVGEIHFSSQDFWAIDTTYYVRLKSDGDYRFWYYLLSILNLNEMNTHSAVPGLNREQVYQIKLKVPNYKEQRAIAKILSDLDERIELNIQINKTLESIAQAIFKRWFVDFEFPNENGAPYLSSGGEMVDSELGEIPKGWKTGKVRDVVIHHKDQVSPVQNPNKVYEHYSIEAFDNGSIPIAQKGEEIRSNKFLVLADTILISKLNPRIKRIWTVVRQPKDGICSTEFLVFKPKDFFYSYFYSLVLSNVVWARLMQMVRGTSSSHQRFSPDDIIDLKIVIPDDETLNLYELLVKAILVKREQNILENIAMEQTRDLLLPKLMSGKIRVPVEE